MWLPSDLDPAPRVFLNRHSRPGHGWKVVSEVMCETQRELLDLANPFFLGEGVDGVLLRVGRHDVAVVANKMAGGKVAHERDADGDVLDLVHRTERSTLRHAQHVRLGLPILVFAEPDRHRLTFLYMWCNRTG